MGMIVEALTRIPNRALICEKFAEGEVGAAHCEPHPDPVMIAPAAIILFG